MTHVVMDSDRKTQVVEAGKRWFIHVIPILTLQAVQQTLARGANKPVPKIPVASCTSWRPAPRCECAMYNLQWEEEESSP